MLDLAVFNSQVDLVAFLICVVPLFGFLGMYLFEAAFHLVKHLKLRHIKSKIKKTFNMSDFNIKPCPFCGSNHITVKNSHFLKFEEFAIKCDGCGMGTPVGCASYIIGLWNNRAEERKPND